MVIPQCSLFAVETAESTRQNIRPAHFNDDRKRGGSGPPTPCIYLPLVSAPGGDHVYDPAGGMVVTRHVDIVGITDLRAEDTFTVLKTALKAH